MYDFLRALFMSLLQWSEGLFRQRGVGSDAQSDRGLLSRGGSRIREWMHAHGAGERKQSDQDGSVREGQGLHEDR